MRYTGPKVRLCRREGKNLFGSEKCQKALGRNPNIPGMHGGKRLGKVSEYGRQLRAKQCAKRIFGLSEKQFSNYFQKASAAKGVTGDMLLQSLETRLDNTIYRAGFAMTRAQARQFSSHGIFLLNGRRIDVPSAQVKPGDVIQVRPSKKGSPVFTQNLETQEGYQVPSWLTVDTKQLAIEVKEIPSAQHFEMLIEPQPIVEFYSR